MATNHGTQQPPPIDPKALEGKKAVVTGGTIGMGQAIVRALTDRGAEVVYTGRSEQRLTEAQAALDTPLAHPVRSDATDMAAIAALGDQVADILGGIDYLFVNQGIAEFQTLEEVTEESWDRIFDVNAKGSFFTVQRLAPLVSEGGSIVFTTVSNDQIFPGLSAYSGAKEAVAAFAKVLAAELLPRSIRVNAIAPGFILTPTMGVAELTDEQRSEFVEQGNATTPMGRGGTVEEVAAAALYLAVEATFTTGLELPVDGGFGQGLGG
ncbi:SDR family NAD(P)-dependent oxidoreductase [Streptomyces sp. ME19-01-6]|uniref:SDR family NAD(P)-dependent oxidoreductase n=1 Tax=Streptomyces sp. ME19-01-6 TaxID=3028686 RepID=UPI0029BA83C9|nr:SDR family oxidoreductase [Streptomyces sp. ME19-01-6]MDX3226725.1 SDR family oxidoreductase [Streptomyces sp. ME19-01-6]